MTRLRASSAALRADGATGQRLVEGGGIDGPARDGQVIVSFETPDLFVAWCVVEHGSPPAHVLPRVRPLRAAGQRAAGA